MRDKRQNDQIRNISFETGVTKYAEGSCLVGFGDTKVLCTASIEDNVPAWMRGTKKGWVHAEYAMLPRATSQRVRRESVSGRQSGRSLEIQRLIGRALRAVVEPTVLGERQLLIDCDVLQADGGTRTASITGAWVAMRLCVDRLLREGILAEDPLLDHVVAISSGLVDGVALLDLEYSEDSRADADANFIFTGTGNLVEVQASGEGKSFSHQEFLDMMTMARSACDKLVELQRDACVRAGAAL